jgi:hypothetical protein
MDWEPLSQWDFVYEHLNVHGNRPSYSRSYGINVGISLVLPLHENSVGNGGLPAPSDLKPSRQ